MRRWHGLWSAAVLLVACGSEPAPTDDDDSAVADPCAGVTASQGTDIRLLEVAAGFDRPTSLTHSADGTGRLFVTEQQGRVWSWRVGEQPVEYLDLSARVSALGGAGDERGLLSLAFHPDFASNGRLLLDYTGHPEDETRVVELRVTGDPLVDAPDPATERLILSQEQPWENHNGGQLAFGPDGYLYVGLGDGGSAGDPLGSGQDPVSWLGSILRLDVDGEQPYAVPPDNPFVEDAAFRPEIWAWGLRNPWRFSFDRGTGDLWIADVGQNRWEEVDIGRAGANYGWSQVEGPECYAPGCDLSAFEAPVYSYDHDAGIAITGGYVYRGCALPELRGTYLFSDYPYFTASPLWSLSWDGAVATRGPVWVDDTGAGVAALGEDEQGELYLVDHVAGRILKIVPD